MVNARMTALCNAAHADAFRLLPAISWGPSCSVESTLVALSLLMSLSLASGLEIDIQSEISTGMETPTWSVETYSLPPRVHEVAVGALGE